MTGTRLITALLLTCAVTLTGCFDRDTAGPTPAAVAEVELSPVSGTLQLGDSIQLTARALSSAGQALAGRTITWSTNSPSILRVSSTGVVVGLSAGQATVTASTGGKSATAAVDVHPWNIAAGTVVIDSTMLRLSGDATERSAGRYRFEVLSAAAPQLGPGQIIVGAEQGGFLRRVVAVANEGGHVIVDTEPASLAGIVRTGGFSASTSLLSGTGLSPAQLSMAATAHVPGRVLWGEGRFESLAQGMTAQAGGFDLADIDVCALLAASGSGAACPSGLDELRFTHGTLAFEPEFQVEAQFAESRLTRFRGVLSGPLGLDVGLRAGASAPVGAFVAQSNLFTFTRPFLSAIGPVPVVGHVQLVVDVRLEVAQSASGAMETALASQSVIQLGAEWAGSWSLIEGNSGSFTAREPALAQGTLAGATQLFARVALVPRAQVIIYGAPGPFAEVQPFSAVTVSRGSATCTMNGTSGLSAAVGFAVPFLDARVHALSHVWGPVLEGPPADWPCPVGGIRVNVSTTGEDIDPDGFTAVLDEAPAGSVGPNDQMTLELVEAGARMLRLDDVAPNCSVQGESERAITVAVGAVSEVAFEVSCVAITGDLEILTVTGGQEADPDGYLVSVAGATPLPMGINDRLLLPGLKPGQTSVELQGVAANCTVAGSNPRTVNVPEHGAAAVTFEITCAATGIDVSVTSTGVPATDDDWELVLNGAVSRAIRAPAQESFSVTAGTHELALQGLPDNCTVQGDNPRSVAVAAGTTADVAFRVECASGTLTVNVSTGGNPWPTVTYTVSAGGRSLAVGVNGTVSFADMPAGPVEVRLEGVPSHCTVQGLNPQTVAVPGTVSIDVVCEPPAICSPTPEVTMLEDIRHHPGEGGTWSGEILAAQWNLMRATANSAAPAIEDERLPGPDVGISMGGSDFIKLLPVDAGRVGESVTLYVEVMGEIEIDGNGDDVDVHAILRYHGLAGGFLEERRYTIRDGTTTGAAGVFPASAIVMVSALLGDWSELQSELHISVGPGSNGSVSAATAQLRVNRLVEVRDAGGNVVPVASACTASGTVY